MYDVLVIGGGLSGGQLVAHLARRLAVRRPRRSGPPVRVALVDRLGAFGRGIPYGAASRPGFLLIEDVATSTPAEFHTWLAANTAGILAGAGGPDPALAAWVERHRQRIVDGEHGGLWVPRQVFGAFAEWQLRTSVDGSRDIELSTVVGDAVDLAPGDGGFEVALADGGGLRGRLAVLAIGCIPRPNEYGLTLADGYVHDLYADGFAGLDRVIAERSAAAGRPVDLLLAGSNAAAAETIYHVDHSADLAARVRHVKVVSRRGYLPGGALGQPPAVNASGGLRPSPGDYIQVARRLAAKGVLCTTSAQILGVERVDAGLRVPVIAERGADTITADVVVNCTGAGRMGTTDAPLLRNLAARPGFAPNATGQGFILRPGEHELADVDGCFVIGPLLNHGPIDTHVESIHAVYRVAEELATTIHSRLVREVAA